MLETKTMSYYGIYDAKFDYMVCNNCSTEAFTWIADIFSCSMCDSDEYVYPDEAGEMLSFKEKYDSSGRVGRISTAAGEIVKKRKRSTSDGENRKHSR